MDVVIDNRQNRLPVDQQLAGTIENTVSASLAIEGIQCFVEVSVSLVDNIEIQKLNKSYRGLDKPTDVLSFPQYDEVDESMDYIFLGDIVISLEKAQEQAKEYGHSFEREVAFLTAHSMLHLLGYDHDSQESTQEMRQKEEEIMLMLGIGRD